MILFVLHVTYSSYDDLFQYLHQKRPTPFQQVSELFALARNHAKREIEQPNCDWIPNTEYRKLRIDNATVGLEDIPSVVAKLLQEGQDVLHQLLKGFEVGKINLCDIQDALDETGCGYSFMTDKRNRLEALAASFRDHMLGVRQEGSEELLYVSLQRSRVGNISWNRLPSEAWLRQSARVLEVILMLLHLTGGQPARGTELGKYLLQNVGATPRNLYICKGTFMVIQRYSKTNWVKENDVAIARFLPPEVSDILFSYLVTIRSFER